MESAPRIAASFSDAELARLLTVLHRADSVELKATVADAHHVEAIRALDLDPLDAQIRQVFYFDTPSLALDSAGVVARARRVQESGDDTVIKLRPVEPESVPQSLRDLPAFGIEVDVMPGGTYVCSGSFKARSKDVRATLQDGGSKTELFSKKQRQLYAQYAPSNLSLDDLSVLGPLFVLKLKIAPKLLGRRLVVELWFYPDGSRILELSTKCPPTEAFQVAAELRGYLHERGVGLSEVQATKTRKALEYFAHQLSEA